MQKCGFIFSLDAFVAFTLTMVTISLLIFTIGTPKPFYPSLQQAQELAYDTLQVLSTTSPSGSPPYYLEYAVSGRGMSRSEVMNKTANGIIPHAYGYKLQAYNFCSGGWATLYDSSNDASSGRANRNFTKLQASSTLFSSFYEIEPVRGESQYCYLSCKGYNGTNPDGSPIYASTCGVTPCDTPTSGFRPGENAVRLVRFVVYT